MEQVGLGSRGMIVRFDARDGVALAGLLSRGHRHSPTCIIFVHGMMGSMTSSVSLALHGHIGRGFDVFSINTRGAGMVSGFSRKLGNGRTRRYTIGTCMERFEDCVHDIGGAVDAARRMGYRRVVLCGHSTGCQKIAYYQYRMRDRRVGALVLVAPADDYNIARKRLGTGIGRIRNACTRMMSSGKGNAVAPDTSGFSAQRLDSILDPGRAEARMFNYDGDLGEFACIKIPVLAVFGSEEENAPRPVAQCLERLSMVSGSRRFDAMLVEGADHNFHGMGKALAATICKWLAYG